jgi:hypothetical protein
VPNKTECSDWLQHFGAQEVFVYDECLTIYRTVFPIARSVSAATAGYGCKKSVLSVLCFCA